MNLYILNYNNYYNRIAKKPLVNIEEYTPYQVYNTLQGVNGWTPNDGVFTNQVIGSSLQTYNGNGDYLVCQNEETGEIDSRWFIIDAVRERSGQWNLSLRRDLIADFYDNLMNAPCFIEKATLSSDNPLIYNREDFTVNQIKTSETLLKDETGCAWIACYYDDTTSESGVVLDANVQEPQPYDIAIAGTLEQWQYWENLGIDIKTPGATTPAYSATVTYAVDGYDAGSTVYTFGSDKGITSAETSTSSPYLGIYADLGSGGEGYIDAAKFRLIMNSGGQGLSYANQCLYNYLGINYLSYLKMNAYTNKILRFTNQAGDGYDYYKITKGTFQEEINNVAITSNFGSLYTHLWQVVGDSNSIHSTTPNNNNFKVKSCKYNRYVFTASKIVTGTKKFEIPDTALKLSDAPYSMFVMPYPDEGKEFVMRYATGANASTVIRMNRSTAMQIAEDIGRKYKGGGKVYDIQILPYCPLTIEEDSEKEGWLYWNTTTAKPNSWTTINNENNSVVGIIFHPEFSSFTKNIPLQLNVSNSKLENQTDMYRLVSPNYNGQFEFNLAKNGSVSFFNVDCTYMPYQPYIHVNPNFNNLYGQDFNDARGLICGGDFSIAQVNDAWETYQIQNKNYNNIFNRQIENMEVQYSVAREQEKWQVGAGVLSGAASGALAGSMMGGPYGAIAGAVVGGTASLIGGLRDIELNEKLRGEALDYTKDQFQMQLGNIQALPMSITKTTAYTYNNKIYPILEYYTCTDVEKEAFANKIAYNGMTVGAIGYISDYIGNYWSYTTPDNRTTIVSKNYIKGKLIRLDSVSDDFHVVNSLAGELYKGVYFE